MSYVAMVGSEITLYVVLDVADVAKYPQAVIYDTEAQQVAGSPVSLVHRSAGYYSVEWTVPVAARLISVITVYTDAGHTAQDTTYARYGDVIDGTPASVLSGLADISSRLPARLRGGKMDSRWP